MKLAADVSLVGPARALAAWYLSPSVQRFEWHPESGPRQPEWRLEVRELEVTLTRIPAVEGGKTRTWSDQLTPEQRTRLDTALAHLGAGSMPRSVYVPRAGGTLTLGDSARRHVVTFDSDAQEPAAEQDWLDFPAGAASDVVALFDGLLAAVYGPPSTLPTWQPPRFEGPPAGESAPLDQRVVLSYAATVPNVADARPCSERFTWFASGRFVIETVWLDRDGGTSVEATGQGQIDPALAPGLGEELRALRFFRDLCQARAGDGEELIVYHHRGARLEKLLSYEVEMGARCGLSPVENTGLDRIRGLWRRSQSAITG